MKKIIPVVILLIVAIIGTCIGVWFMSNKPVQFTLNGNDYTVGIYDTKDTSIRTLKTSETIRLPEGSYTYKVEGTNYDTSATQFTVTGNETVVSITPKRSVSYLAELLNKERSAIETILKNTYPAVAYTVTSLTLHGQGEWAAGQLQLSGNPRQLRDTYRFILKKEGESWKVIVSPRITIEATEFPSVPKELINDLYSANL